MRSSQTFPGGLHVEHRMHPTSATVRIGGCLKFPDAVAVAGVVRHVIEQRPPVVILDLTDVESVDGTGVAVLVGLGGDLKHSGIQVRVVTADLRIRRRLPYTLGLRKVFRTVDEAESHVPHG